MKLCTLEFFVPRPPDVAVFCMASHLLGPPVAYPLKTLEQLADPGSVDYAVMKCSVPLAVTDKPCRPRLLVCHDFKGGYQDDKWIQGNDNGDAYSLWHWDLTDVFVYFSHNLVTLPPPGWTNAAHKHGVQVLGTLITEWREGAELCRTLLQSSESVQLYASRLAELAHDLGFDGWLLNIENPIEGYQMGFLLEFVQLLTGMMHSLVPGSMVIWYDAVTIQGKLVWQNCLNRLNQPFFDVCDGIFTNYSWTMNSPRESAKVAGDRPFDVYMGVDVFGRNTFGGGGFQTDVALQVARASGVSAAIFAPGWVYETGQGPNFHAAQDRWWGSIKACWPRARRNPVRLPFFSNFDQGIGDSVCVGGHKVFSSPWSNLSCQNLQVLFDTHHYQLTNGMQVLTSQEAAYHGGSCVKISGTLSGDDIAIINLYHSNLVISKGSLHISYSVALEVNSQLVLALEVEFMSGRRKTLFLTEPGLQNLSLADRENVDFAFRTPINAANGLFEKPATSDRASWSVREYVLEMEACEVTNIHALVHCENSHHTALKQKYRHLFSVSPVEELSEGKAATGGDDEVYPKLGSQVSYCALLGHIRVAMWPATDCGIIAAQCNFQTRHAFWVETDVKKRCLSIELFWELRDLHPNHTKTQGCQLEHCKVYSWEDTSTSGSDKPTVPLADVRFLGVAKLNWFFVDQVQINQGSKSVRFALQRFCVCGGWEDLSQAPVVTVDVPPQ